MFWVFSSFFLSLSLSSLFVLGDEESLDVRGWLEFKSVFEVEIVELLGGGGGFNYGRLFEEDKKGCNSVVCILDACFFFSLSLCENEFLREIRD